MTTPLHLTGLQDWYLRACDGEIDGDAGVPTTPREAGLAWCGLLQTQAATDRRRPAGRTQQSRRDARGTRHL